MHDPKQEDFVEEDQIQPITNQIYEEPKRIHEESKEVTINTTQDLKYKKMSKINCSIDEMIHNLRQFEQNIYSQLYWGMNQAYNEPIYCTQMVPPPAESFKRRKTSEADSFFNGQSAESTLHPPTPNQEMNYIQFQYNNVQD